MEDYQLPHKLTLDERKKLTVTGVSDVVSFDENTVILHTTLGTLIVQGEQLQLKTLSTEGGQVAVEGTVFAVQYQQSGDKGGWLSRLFR